MMSVERHSAGRPDESSHSTSGTRTNAPNNRPNHAPAEHSDLSADAPDPRDNGCGRACMNASVSLRDSEEARRVKTNPLVVWAISGKRKKEDHIPGRVKTKPSMRGGKSSGPVQRIWAGSPRTSPSPSASVDLAHLRPRPRSRLCTPDTHPLSPRPRESPPRPRQTLRADADVTVTLNHLFGVARRKDVARKLESKGRRHSMGRRSAMGPPPGFVTGSSSGRHAHQGTACLPHPLIDVRSAPIAQSATPAPRLPPTAARSAAPRPPSGGRSSSRPEASPPSPPAADAPPPRSPSCRRPCFLIPS